MTISPPFAASAVRVRVESVWFDGVKNRSAVTMFVCFPASRKLSFCSLPAKRVRSLSPLMSLKPISLAPAT